jgi:hypothetical protein
LRAALAGCLGGGISFMFPVMGEIHFPANVLISLPHRGLGCPLKPLALHAFSRYGRLASLDAKAFPEAISEIA